MTTDEQALSGALTRNSKISIGLAIVFATGVVASSGMVYGIKAEVVSLKESSTQVVHVLETMRQDISNLKIQDARHEATDRTLRDLEVEVRSLRTDVMNLKNR